MDSKHFQSKILKNYGEMYKNRLVQEGRHGVEDSDINAIGDQK